MRPGEVRLGTAWSPLTALVVGGIHGWARLDLARQDEGADGSDAASARLVLGLAGLGLAGFAMIRWDSF